VHVAAGATATVSFSLPPAAFGLVDARGDMVCAPGDYALTVTASPMLGGATVPVTVTGDEVVLEPYPTESAAGKAGK
jgi:hypothetical protein